MKKTLLTLSLAIATIFASAQCTPDPQFSAPGIYPDSTTGLSHTYTALLPDYFRKLLKTKRLRFLDLK